MGAKDWILQAERKGWRVRKARGGILEMRCCKAGCDGSLVLPIGNLGPTPEPCKLSHVGEYSEKTFNSYIRIVDELKRRRRSLGLSQEDVTEASGFTDGHINKLEVADRVAQPPTLAIWAETLGLTLALVPAPLPPVTLKVMDNRTADLRETTHQKELFNE